MWNFWASDLWKSRHICFQDSLWKNNCIFHWSIVKLFKLVLWRVKYANHKLFIVSHRFKNFILLSCTSYGPAWLKGWKGQKNNIMPLWNLRVHCVFFEPCKPLLHADFCTQKMLKKFCLFSLALDWIFFTVWLIFLPFFFSSLFLLPSLSLFHFSHYNKLSEMQMNYP